MGHMSRECPDKKTGGGFGGGSSERGGGGGGQRRNFSRQVFCLLGLVSQFLLNIFCGLEYYLDY